MAVTSDNHCHMPAGAHPAGRMGIVPWGGYPACPASIHTLASRCIACAAALAAAGGTARAASPDSYKHCCKNQCNEQPLICTAGVVVAPFTHSKKTAAPTTAPCQWGQSASSPTTCLVLFVATGAWCCEKDKCWDGARSVERVLAFSWH